MKNIFFSEDGFIIALLFKIKTIIFTHWLIHYSWTIFIFGLSKYSFIVPSHLIKTWHYFEFDILACGRISHCCTAFLRSWCDFKRRVHFSRRQISTQPRSLWRPCIFRPPDTLMSHFEKKVWLSCQYSQLNICGRQGRRLYLLSWAKGNCGNRGKWRTVANDRLDKGSYAKRRVKDRK